MGKFINIDSPFNKFVTKVLDILILNLIWVICSIPIITIGASTTAVYYVTLKLVKDEEVYVVKSFFKSFRENFKQSTIIWLLFSFFGAVIGVIYYYLFKIAENPSLLIRGVIALATVLYAFCVLYAFPLLSRYNNSIGRTILNSFVISIRYFSRTIIIIILIAVLTVIGIYNTNYLFIIILFGFGILTYMESSYVIKVFEDLERLREKYEEGLMNQMDENEEELNKIEEEEVEKDIKLY